MSSKMRQFNAGTWAHQSRLYATNAGILIDQGQALLIDPGIFPDELEEIAGLLKQEHAAPTVLALTHGHWDHILGPEHFDGVPVIAQQNYTRQVSGEKQASILKAINSLETARTQPFTIPTPQQTFEQRLSIQIGSLHVEFIHIPGHTCDQAAVYCAGCKTLWAGDVLSSFEIPSIYDSLTAYRESIQTLSQLEIETLIPGHGSPAVGKAEVNARFAREQAYLNDLHEHVKLAVRRGLSEEETLQFCAWEKNSLYTEDQETREYNEPGHRENVITAYRQWDRTN